MPVVTKSKKSASKKAAVQKSLEGEQQQPPATSKVRVKVPPWFRNFSNKFLEGQAHMFVLHFNVSDFVIASVDMSRFLTANMPTRNLVIRYNIAEGIEFCGVTAEDSLEMRRTFIRTTGLDQQLQAMAALAAATGRQVGTIDDIPLPRDPGAAFPLIEKVLRTEALKVAVIIEYSEMAAPTADIAGMSPQDRQVVVHLQRWARDLEIKQRGPIIVLLAEALTDIHPAIRRSSARIPAIEVPLPNYGERLETIRLLVEAGATLAPELTDESLARSTAGLARMHLHEIAMTAFFHKKSVDRALVRRRKQEIIESEFAEVIEVSDRDVTFEDIGGLEYIKEFFRRSVIEPFKHGNSARMPMGILFLGPAGTGKSITFHAVAKEAGVNAVVLNPAKIFGSYVGQSERNLERALKCIEAMTPCIVFIDEFDQAMQRNKGESDGGVSARLFKRLMEFMSDGTHRGKVLWIAATNRPDMVDPAFKRPGRFDRKLAFLLPEDEERESLLRVFAKKYLGEEHVEGLFKKDKSGQSPASAFADDTYGWTGAEIEDVCLVAYEYLADGLAANAAEALALAIEDYVPATSEIDKMTDLAIKELNRRSLAPPSYRHLLQGRTMPVRKARAAS